MYNIRPAEEGDIAFLLNSWLKRYRDAVHPRLVTDRVYFEAQHAVIRKILSGNQVKVAVAVDPEDPAHIYGYCVGEALTDDWVMLHWVYVKGAFRRFGLAKSLISNVVGSATKVSYSHRTKLVDYLDKKNEWVFTPQYVWALI